MRREILSEINRFREIIGLNILNEGIIPSSLVDDLAKAFGKSEDEFFQRLEKKELTALNKVFDDVANTTGKSSDELIQGFKSGTLDDFAEDLFVSKLIQSGTENLKQAAIKAYSTTKPELVSFIDTAFNGMEQSIKQMSDEKYQERLAKVDSIIDDSAMTDEMRTFLKNEYKERSKAIRLSSSIKNLGNTNAASETSKLIAGKSFDDLYTLYSAKLTNAGKKPMTKDELLKLASAAESDFKGDSKSLIEYLVEVSKDKVAMGKRLKQIFGVTEEIVDGTGKIITKGSENAANTVKPWGWGKLMMALVFGGIGLVYFKSDNIFDWWNKKDGVRKPFLVKFGDAYTDLPKPLQKKLELNYNSNDFNLTANNAYLKSMDFNNQEESDTDSSVLTIRFNDGTFDKYSNNVGDREKWTLDPSSTHTKEEGAGNTTTTTTSNTTKQNVIDAIIGQGYTEPITLNPDEEPKSGVKTVYNYTDAGGIGGTATVDEAGKITVV